MKKKKLPVIFTLKQALDAGASRRFVESRVSKGEVLKIGHGIYYNVKSGVSLEYVDFFSAFRKFGEESYIGGLSALFYYGLIDISPQQVWVVVPHNKRTVETKYRLIRTRKVYNYGLKREKFFIIADIDRAIVDAFRYSSKIGLRTAYQSAVRAISEKKTTISNIILMADKLECGQMMKKHADTIVGMMEA